VLTIGRIEEILNVLSAVPIALVQSPRRHKFAGALGHTWRDMIPANPPFDQEE
jgi:hypothetical protein